MTTKDPLSLALEYLRIYYDGEDLDLLHDIFAEDLTFRGPLYQYESAHDYVEALKKNPPAGVSYSVISSHAGEDSACVIYEFKSDRISTPMAQLFETNEERITKITLIFDRRAFE